jgi:hypothetical protein
MIARHQAPHFDRRVLESTLLLLIPFFLALLAAQVDLPGLLAAHEGRSAVLAVLIASLCAVTLAWWRRRRRDFTSPRRIGRGI